MSHAAIVIPGLDHIAGAEQQVMLLAKGLRRRAWRVSVVALSGTGGAAAKELVDAGVEFLSLKMRKGLLDPRGWLRFHRWLRYEQPDVLHAHLTHAVWFTRWSRLAASVPVVIDTIHNCCAARLGRRLCYWCSRWLPDHVTAVGQAAAQAYVAAHAVSQGRLSVVGNGVDVDSWKPDARARAAVREELGIKHQFLWLAVGRLEPVKDYATLLNAFAHVPSPSHLLVLGTGPLAAELKQLATRLGLSERVEFAGFEPQVKRWMQAADGFVLSSRREGLPMVLLEAGACGVPVVATDVPGTREVIVDGETGWLAPAGDPERLATAMSWLMHTPSGERRTMGQRARQHVIRNFSLETVLDRWEQLYGELLERKSPNRRKAPATAAWENLRRRSAHSA
jgi:glycosyltransferase involved in cell wall biosynthesis